MKLIWLELGRGFAAFSVLLCHAVELGLPPQLQFFTYFGDWGVCFFFVLSGFIIYHVHADDIGKGQAASNFLQRRLLRIVPTYWLLLTTALLLRAYVANPDYAVEMTSYFLLKNYFLLPGGTLFISPAWTLRHELLFYGIFLLAILNRSAGLSCFAIWLCIILWHTYTSGVDDGKYHPAIETLASYRNLFFFVGLAISYLYLQGKISIAIVASATAACMAFALGAYIPILLAVCATLVSTCAALSTKGIALAPIFMWFGAISYPLYLFHRTSFLISHGIFKRLGVDDTWPMLLAASIAIALTTAHLIHRYFERPVLSRKKVLRRGFVQLSYRE